MSNYPDGTFLYGDPLAQPRCSFCGARDCEDSHDPYEEEWEATRNSLNLFYAQVNERLKRSLRELGTTDISAVANTGLLNEEDEAFEAEFAALVLKLGSSTKAQEILDRWQDGDELAKSWPNVAALKKLEEQEFQISLMKRNAELLAGVVFAIAGRAVQ